MKRISSFSLLLLAFLSTLILTACDTTPLPPEQSDSGYSTATGSDGLIVHFIDVGQADAALVVCDGEAMLIDGGNVEDPDNKGDNPGGGNTPSGGDTPSGGNPGGGGDGE